MTTPDDTERFTADTVVQSRWDKADYQDTATSLTALAQTRDKLAAVSAIGEDLAGDLFTALHKRAPLKAPDVPASHAVNERIRDEMFDASSFQDLRALCTGDPFAAGVGLRTMADKLADLYERHADIQEAADQAQAAADAERAALDEALGEHPDGEFPQDLADRLEQLHQATESLTDQVLDQLDAAGAQIGQAVRAAMGEAASELEGEAAAAAAWGLNRGQLASMDATARLQLAGELRGDLMRRIAALFGKFRAMAFGALDSRWVRGPDEIYGIELGNDLETVLPSELAMLKVPALRLDFYRRFAEGELLCYEMRRHERVGRGGIVFCTDTDTEILTRAGWRRYDELEVGDIVLTLNHDTGLSEWQPLRKVNVFPAERRQMLHLKNQRHDSLTTLDHRWPVLTGSAQVREWRTSATLASSNRLVLSAPCASLPTTPKYEDALVELVAWAWTEGTLPHPRGTTLRIAQSGTVNPDHCESIRRALTALYGPAHDGDMRAHRSTGLPAWRERPAHDSGVIEFHLNRHASAPITAHLGPDKAVDPEFLADLTQGQLLLFIERSVDGDGQRRPSCRILGQRSLERVRSFEIACALAGFPTTTSTYPDKGTFQYVTYVRDNDRTMPLNWYGPTFTHDIVEHDGIVWCPTVNNGTWLARRNGKVFFTGNCEDSSDSMRMGAGEPYVWAKAVGLALASIAGQQDRRFTAILFGGPDQTAHYPVPPGDTTAMLDYAKASFTNAGTDYQAPLREALELLAAEQENDGRVTSDIVFVTDMLCRIPAAFKEWFLAEKARIGARVWAISIGAPVSPDLTAIADRAAELTDLLGDDGETFQLFTDITTEPVPAHA